MKFTQWQVNSITAMALLFVIQMAVLWLLHQGPDNGSAFHDLVTNKEFDVLTALFLPTAGIVWALKRFSSDVIDRGD